MLGSHAVYCTLNFDVASLCVCDYVIVVVCLFVFMSFLILLSVLSVR